MLALLWKEIRAESRTRETLSSLLFVGLLTLLVLGFALDAGSGVRTETAVGALWLAVTFSAVNGLNRSFQSERENGTLQGLLLGPVDRGTIFLAKVTASFLFLLLAQGGLVPAFLLLFGITPTPAFLWILLVLFLALLGFAALGCLFAAMAVRTRVRELMLPLLLLPLVLPLLLGGVRVSQRVLEGRALGEEVSWIHLMVGFDFLAVVVGWLVFEYVVEE